MKAKAQGRFTGTITGMAILLILGFAVSAGADGAGAGPSPRTPPKSDARQMLEQFWVKAYGAGAPSSATPAIPDTSAIPATPVQLSGDEPFATLSRELLAKAKPDECFDGIGIDYPPGPPCSEGKPKVNQAYVWGLAKSGNNIWLGTAPNVQCLAMGAYGPSAMDPNIPLEPRETASWVCEFGSSQYSRNYPNLSPASGDWRPPRIYVYDTVNKILTEKTPKDPAFQGMTGVRAGGSLGKLVFMAGPGTPGPSKKGTITISAFLSDSGTYLGTKTLLAYNNIRKWLVVNNILYTAVRNVSGPFQGSVLRWTGELVLDSSTGKPDLNKLFQFTVVGNLKDGEGAELAEHEGRLFVTTWPDNIRAGEEITTAALYMSPHIPEGGLTSADADGWTRVWQVDDYEPDQATAATYGGGALASFDGYLYWGTMHVPLLSALAHFKYYGMPDNQEDILADILATYRPISIFRGSNFDTTPQMEVVYGMPYLPKYVPAGPDLLSDPGHWEIVPNKMGPPLWGLSGFGNFFNNYTWTMSVYQHQLFIGTMDWSYFVGEEVPEFLDLTAGFIPKGLLQLPTHFYGADLFRIQSSQIPAAPESLAGIGNYTSYGIRTMLSDNALYLGMANPMNLLTDPNDDLPEGGWELIKLTTPLQPLQVSMDISPGSCPNEIPLMSEGYLLLPVAISGTPDLDVSQIDPDTIVLTSDTAGNKISPVSSMFDDVSTPFEGEPCACYPLDGDGYTDLVLFFNSQEIIKKFQLGGADLVLLSSQKVNKNIHMGEDRVPLTLTGRLKEEYGGTPFEGHDCVSIERGW